ncbi:hypothetical protein GGI42DRAFT_344083 [Trichoderma sp. SZMC 28013]
MAQPVRFGRPLTVEEARLYYYGIPPRPRLIARSGTRMWVNPQMPGPTTFLGTQNMYLRVLQPILDAVGGMNWTALDILRVGLNGGYRLTLMIAVLPDSLSWNDGHPIALYHEVECEIRESVVNFCTNAALGTATDIEETSLPIT